MRKRKMFENENGLELEREKEFELKWEREWERER